MDDLLQSTSEYQEDELITITLDESSTTFKVSKLLLFNASDYFRKALQGRFVEAETRTLRLPGYGEDVVHMLLCYLHKRSLPDFQARVDLMLDTADPDNKQVDQFLDWAVRLVASLWQFGDEHLMPKLQNEAMRRLLVLMDKNIFTPSDLRGCFEGTAEGSLLREALVGEAVADWKLGRRKKPGEMDALAAIPGFFELFCQKLVACPTKCEHRPLCRPCSGENWRKYMVKED